MRGEKEQKCLNFVRNNIGLENYYGFSKDDKNKFDFCLKSAIPNNKPNDFPDFIFNDGFIEHFQISSGKSKKDGSEHLKGLNTYLKNNIKTVITNINNGDYNPYYTTYQYPEHKYMFLKNSLELAWKSHIKSMNKYDGNKSIGIFMIEYQDSAIEMLENTYSNVKKGVTCGGIRQQKSINHYSIYHDKRMLNFLYENKETIQYVIYVYNKGVEIINVSNIPELLKHMPFDYYILPMSSTVRIDTYIPNSNIED